MEKEEKIAEQRRRAEEMSFYGSLRRFYPLFAIIWMSLIRFVFKHLFAFRPNACAFMFPVGSLTIINLPVTGLVAFLTQVALNIKIFPLPDGEVYKANDLLFSAAFVIGICVLTKFF